MDEPPSQIAIAPKPAPFYGKTDWQAFGLTALLIFIVYCFSLAPEVGLSFSGVYATDAFYPGPSIPPGHPLWAIYGWIFIKLIPFSNIAWRLGVASAFAGSVTCGLIALVVSRIGLLAAEDLQGFRQLSASDQSVLRIICGAVAGLSVGLDSSFWSKAVMADTWPLSLLLYTITFMFLTRWFFRPEARLPLCLAFFTSALAMVESEALIPAVLGLLFILVSCHRKVARDALILTSLGLLSLHWFGRLANNALTDMIYVYYPIFFGIAILAVIVAAVLCWVTRAVFTEWKILAVCIALFGVGFSSCLLTAVFSMTDPPINWGYPRAVEGFFHAIGRGQYDLGEPNFAPTGIVAEWRAYFFLATKDWGVFYLIAAMVPLFFLRKLPAKTIYWLVSVVLVWLFSCLIMLGVVFSQPTDRSVIEANAPFFAVTHLQLAFLTGIGLVLLGTALCTRLSAIRQKDF